MEFNNICNFLHKNFKDKHKNHFKTENLEEPTFKPTVSNSQNVFELQ